jgi:hypothetical protein
MVMLHADWVFEGDIEPLHFMTSGATEEQCMENFETTLARSPQYPHIRVENLRIERTDHAEAR